MKPFSSLLAIRSKSTSHADEKVTVFSRPVKRLRPSAPSNPCCYQTLLSDNHITVARWIKFIYVAPAAASTIPEPLKILRAMYHIQWYHYTAALTTLSLPTSAPASHPMMGQYELKKKKKRGGTCLLPIFAYLLWSLLIPIQIQMSIITRQLTNSHWDDIYSETYSTLIRAGIK